MAKPGFWHTGAERAFDAAYDRALAAWPEGTATLDVATDLGTTRVYAVGPEYAPVVVLLAGAGATAMSWHRNVAALGRRHRVLVPDIPGQPGRSTVVPHLATGAEAVLAWLDELLARLDVADCTVCGHSYGAWLALYYALGSQPRCRSVALLDPTTCFTEPPPAHRLRALPALVLPGPGTLRSFVRWETRGRAVEPLSHAVQLAGAGFRGVGTEFPRRPNRQALRALELPILVVAAGRSRLHDVDAMLAEARSTGPNVATATVAGASHFTLPATDAEAVNEALLAHLDRSTT